MALANQKLNKKDSTVGGVRLYLRIHVMPVLNKPLRGRAWQWISPFVALAILIVAIFYFLAD
ncbi:MAG TPA: hypothetical protein PLA05_00660 [bacterium]|jgi:hypothetical protein|nr:MAG: hypothetical protein BWX82_00179 [Parcubacteria group bacterium ADurb.Bin115]HNU81309.1 hypothetical protein [bacterium]HOD86762.1 hypothetical protein [bacterium]HPW05465.1 hypothetical protein [bacterium]HQB76191.1 hypothetical protein [bacterium]